MTKHKWEKTGKISASHIISQGFFKQKNSILKAQAASVQKVRSEWPNEVLNLMIGPWPQNMNTSSTIINQSDSMLHSVILDEKSRNASALMVDSTHNHKYLKGSRVLPNSYMK